MGILKDFEKRLEGAVEGFFARAFRSGLQPVELAKALQRYAQNYQQVGIDGVFVPNVYRFELAPDDHERFSGFADSLTTELAAVVRRTAAERGWRLKGPARIELRPSDEITVGTYELRGKVDSSAPPAPKQPAPAPAAPRPAPAVSAPLADAGHTAVLQRPAGGGAALVADSGRRFELSGSTMTLGRLPECEITLDDASVSRRHARITRNGSSYQIVDLDSTNGVRLNGELVASSTLSNGDRLELGTVGLVFTVEV